jgi:putative ATP-binding cassette transporter
MPLAGQPELFTPETRRPETPLAPETSEVTSDQKPYTPQEETPFLSRRQIRKLLAELILLATVDGVANAFRLHALYSVIQLSPGASRDQLFVLFLFTIVVGTVATRLFRRRIATLTEDLIANARLQLLDRLRQTSLSTLERLGNERLYTALTSDLRAMSDVSFAISFTVSMSVRTISLFGYLALLSLPLFLLEMLLFGLVGIVYLANQFRVKQSVEQVRQSETLLFEAITHLLEGFKELRLNNKKSDAFFQRCLKPLCSQVKQAELTSSKYNILNYTIVYGVWMASIAWLPFLLPMIGAANPAVIRGIGVLLVLPINVLVEAVPQILLAIMSFRRIVNLATMLKTIEPEPEEVAPELQQRMLKSLEYQQIVFQYRDEEDYPFTVGPIAMDIPPGQPLFLIGGNGSGKTTLLKVLLGLYAADDGHTWLNGQEVDMRQHRYLFSAVFTDFHLFDRFYGLQSVAERRVNELLILMQLDQKVQFREGQFSTLNLSTGQQKRLALIAALLEERPILVLDEWAAGQDPYFRQYFYEVLLPAFKAQGKTVIAITHDDHYFSAADHIVKMEYGQIVEHDKNGPKA